LIPLYSDDFGYNKQADWGIIRLIRRGNLLGTSVLSTMASSESLKSLSSTLDGRKGFILGLHINLIEGKPAQDYKKITSLVDKKGHFFSLFLFTARLFFGKIKKAHIESEIEAQFKKLRKLGFRVKMLDSHQHIHALSPIAEITVDLARGYNIPLIRSFGSVKTYSLKAKITYLALKILAFLSHLAAYKEIGMPASWKIKQKFDWTVMSWEDEAINISSIKNKKAAFIIHPYLTFDTNRSYLRYIE